MLKYFIITDNWNTTISCSSIIKSFHKRSMFWIDRFNLNYNWCSYNRFLITSSWNTIKRGYRTGNVYNQYFFLFLLINIFSLQFDTYLRSLSIDPNSPNFRLVTDGQLPLRQCLHPEATAKDINLPSYYWKFSDLRKEYVRFKAGDLSRALIPIVDAKKLQNIPLPPLPLSLSDIMKGEWRTIFFIEWNLII